jgi:outer membrane protein OmpA-like peptidoglycan-associated protein
LQALKSGSIIALRNVFFATSSFELRETSFTELDRLVQVLMNNPELKVSLEGHTDNEGSPSSNQKLSENRAKAVHDYLISKGVLKSRLQFKGFGEQKPIASNETEEGRQRNRRTELRIL